MKGRAPDRCCAAFVRRGFGIHAQFIEHFSFSHLVGIQDVEAAAESPLPIDDERLLGVRLAFPSPPGTDIAAHAFESLSRRSGTSSAGDRPRKFGVTGERLGRIVFGIAGDADQPHVRRAPVGQLRITPRFICRARPRATGEEETADPHLPGRSCVQTAGRLIGEREIADRAGALARFSAAGSRRA